MNTLLTARHLVKQYGNRTAVADVDLTVAPGEVVAIIGPNGAGKSTTIEMILGLRRPDSGTITFWCAEPQRHIGVQLQTTPFFRRLTVTENLQMFTAFYGKRLTHQQTHDLLADCGLAEAAHIEASKLSIGQQKRLAVALALTHHPQLIFLDEPTAALDPRARRDIRDLIRSLAKAGTAIVFTSHDMEEVGKLADRVLLIVAGHVRANGTPTDMLAHFHADSLEDLYLRLTTEEE